MNKRSLTKMNKSSSYKSEQKVCSKKINKSLSVFLCPFCLSLSNKILLFSFVLCVHLCPKVQVLFFSARRATLFFWLRVALVFIALRFAAALVAEKRGGKKLREHIPPSVWLVRFASQQRWWPKWCLRGCLRRSKSPQCHSATVHSYCIWDFPFESRLEVSMYIYIYII